MPSSSDKLWNGLMAVLLAAFCYVIYDSFTERLVEVGDTGPNFSMTTDAGKKVTRDNFGGKILVLNFWASWCQPCVEEIPSLNELQKQLGPSGLVVLGISVDKNKKNYDLFRKRARLVFDTSLDSEANISASYGTFKYPETYIMGPDGKVIEKIISNRNWVTDPVFERLKGLLKR